MDLTEKIKQILLQKNISPSLFADEIGIQRSSISHILAGRNRPSLDIVQKIVKRFPELGLNWILDDEELTQSTPGPETDRTMTEKTFSSRTKPGLKTETQSNRKSQSSNLRVSDILTPPLPTHPTGKVVDRVVIFYTDGTYQEFK